MSFTYNVSMFQQTFESSFTYLNGFMRNVQRFAKRPALFDPETEKRWTYQDLNNDVNKLANALHEDGVHKNDVLMYQVPNCAEFVHCYLAPQKLGAINSPINFRLAPGETALAIDDSKPKVFVYAMEIRDIVQEALAMCVHAPEVLIAVRCSDSKELPPGHMTYEDYVRDQTETEPVRGDLPHIYDETTRLYTSGTTSKPKGVPLNNINEVLSAHDVMMHFPLTPMDRTMNMTPWFHRGGLHSGGPCPTLYAGGEVIILREFSPKRCLSYAEKYEVTFLIGVPAILSLLAQRQERHPSDLSQLKGIVTMGSPLEKAACEHFHKVLTPNIFNGYGTTETFWNTFLRPYDLPRMAGSAGRSCTDDDVRVVKVYEDRKAEPHELVSMDGQEIGEVILRSPSKSSYNYYNNPEETERKFYKGFMYTGDLATWDEDQFITIVGRKDDMIVSAGENIYPSQVEQVLNQHPKVAESAVVGVMDRIREQAVTAYIVPADNSVTAAELGIYCMEHPMLSIYKCPRYYRFVTELPYTATGKLMHYRVSQMAAEDQAANKLERP
ncbi:MAG: AMP-binding protein [Firmicutes bacterium]|nr:AMP-binding protein [Bacillota bacterium]NBI65075.1 long-chain fatty acid--CoA ligase [Clostridiales bacterium]